MSYLKTSKRRRTGRLGREARAGIAAGSGNASEHVNFPTHRALGLACACDICEHRALIVIDAIAKQQDAIPSTKPQEKIYDNCRLPPIVETPALRVEERDDQDKQVIKETTVVRKQKPIPPLKPFFVSEPIIEKVIDSLKNNPITVLVGETQTGKTSLVKYAAYILKKNILEIDDLDYDDTTSPLLNQISSVPKILKDSIILFDVIDSWPTSMLNRVVALCKSKDKWASHVAVICQDNLCFNTKKVVGAVPKQSLHRLYTKKMKSCTKNFDCTFGIADNFDSSFAIARKMLSTKTAKLDYSLLQSNDFLEKIIQWNYLSFFQSKKFDLATLEFAEKMSDMFSLTDTIDFCNLNELQNYRSTYFACTVRGIKKFPGRQVYPNVNFLLAKKKTNLDTRILSYENMWIKKRVHKNEVY